MQEEHEMTEQNSEWQAPPPPPSEPAPEAAQISEAGTLGTIFIEPERTFQDLRRKPRFIIAGIIIALLVAAYAFGLAAKVGEAGMRTFIAEQIDKSPQADSLSKEQKAGAVDLQMKIGKYSRFAVPILVFISFFIGGLLYWLGAKAFGGTGSFMQNVSVWVYSGLPPAVISMLASFVVMAVKSADDIDIAASQKSLVNANLGILMGKEHPVLATLLSTFDVFAIWGWILAAIGLTVVNKMSKGASWTLVAVIVLIGLGIRVVIAMLTGNAS
jgi:hypothetical protein